MSWIDILQTAGIITSFLMAFVQLRLYMKSLNASSHASILARLDSLNRLIFDNIEEYSKLKEKYDDSKFVEDDRRTHLMDIILSLFEEVYFQHYKYGFISKEVMNAWERTVKATFEFSYARGYWNNVKGEYPESFKKYVDQLLQNQ